MYNFIGMNNVFSKPLINKLIGAFKLYDISYLWSGHVFIAQLMPAAPYIMQMYVHRKAYVVSTHILPACFLIMGYKLLLEYLDI